MEALEDHTTGYQMVAVCCLNSRIWSAGQQDIMTAANFIDREATYVFVIEMTQRSVAAPHGYQQLMLHLLHLKSRHQAKCFLKM